MATLDQMESQWVAELKLLGDQTAQRQKKVLKFVRLRKGLSPLMVTVKCVLPIIIVIMGSASLAQ